MNKKIDKIFHILKIFFKEDLRISINNKTKIISGDIIDSLDFLKLVTFIEKKFKIIINENEFTKKNFDTIKNIIAFINKKNK